MKMRTGKCFQGNFVHGSNFMSRALFSKEVAGEEVDIKE
jgi:hypothetical protein